MTVALTNFPQGLSLDQNLLLPLLGIVWINLLLSGDNAVVIALVCRRLPQPQQRAGLALGSLAAIVLRIAMAFVVSYLLRVEGLRIVAGLFLLYVAAKLVWDESGHEAEAKPATSLWSAVVAITVADVGMSLDNVLAIAALARDNSMLLVIGIALSVPLVIVGATIVKAVVDRPAYRGLVRGWPARLGGHRHLERRPVARSHHARAPDGLPVDRYAIDGSWRRPCVGDRSRTPTSSLIARDCSPSRITNRRKRHVRVRVRSIRKDSTSCGPMRGA